MSSERQVVESRCLYVRMQVVRRGEVRSAKKKFFPPNRLHARHPRPPEADARHKKKNAFTIKQRTDR